VGRQGGGRAQFCGLQHLAQQQLFGASFSVSSSAGTATAYAAWLRSTTLSSKRCGASLRKLVLSISTRSISRTGAMRQPAQAHQGSSMARAAGCLAASASRCWIPHCASSARASTTTASSAAATTAGRLQKARRRASRMKRGSCAGAAAAISPCGRARSRAWSSLALQRGSLECCGCGAASGSRRSADADSSFSARACSSCMSSGAENGAGLMRGPGAACAASHSPSHPGSNSPSGTGRDSR